MQKVQALTFTALLLALSTLTFPATSMAGTTEVNERLENQSGRVQRGKHKMTNAEQTRCDERDYRIEAEEQAMRTKHGGKLTKRDRRRLNRQLNNNSGDIRADKARHHHD